MYRSRRISLLPIIVLVSTLFSFAQKPITLEDIWVNGSVYPKSIRGFINLNDGTSYCKLERDDNGNSIVVKYDYATGDKKGVIIDGSAIAAKNGLENFQFSSFDFSADEGQALIPQKIHSIYRRSYEALYYIWNKDDNSLSLIDSDKIRYATFSPQADKVAYVKANDLYVRDLLKGKTRRITKDGLEDQIINGAVDWVYEEEFAMSKGFDWNSDGTKIAYYKFDESAVKEWTMPIYGDLYPELDVFKYPKAGEDNSKVYVHICDLKKGKDRQLELGSERDQYLPRIKWSKDPNTLSVQRLNRLQNKWELLVVDASKGAVSLAMEHNDERYVDITDDMLFLEDGRHFIMKRERDNWHLFMHKVDGPQVFEITKGDWEVDQLLGVDEKNQKVYFTATKESSIERHIYVCDIDGKNLNKLSSGSGWHSARFSSDFSLFFHTVSTANTPPVYSIRKNDGSLLRVLEDNADFQQRMDDWNMSTLEFDELEMGDYSLNYYMIKPSNFDANKKYPLLMFVYGGPGSQQVRNGFLYSNFFWHQMLANEHGYIIACVDNRGTGGKGAEFKKMTYLQLGKYETEDQINAAKTFGQLPYVDAGRIGIWGWSYGGYMSSLCITKGNDVFKTAIAVAPVTNWRYYDNIYTERFMRTPQENGDNYDINSPINHVDSIKGNYLIIHGTADDNVHFQNAAEMVRKMVSKNIPFDSEYYPNRNHGISGGYTRMHLFKRMTDYILENL